MAHTVLMPKAGQSMTEGRVVSWLKKRGDRVERGEPLLEIETDKANLEVEALAAGVLREILVGEGESCPVLHAVGVIADPDEDYDVDALVRAAREAAGPASEGPGGGEAGATGGTGTSEGRGPGGKGPAGQGGRGPAGRAPAGPGTAGRGPAGRDSGAGARRPPASRPAPPASAGPPTPGSATSLAPSPPPGSPAPPAGVDGRGRRVLASPLARRLAQERGVSLAGLRGSGPGGRILRRDVEAADVPGNGAAVAAGGYPLPSLLKPPPAPSPRPAAEEPLTGMRGAIASALQQSKNTAPHFYVTATIDVTQLLAFKEERARAGLRVTVNDLVVRAATLALADEPRVNCRVHDDRIEYPEDIHVGIAVGTDEGLVVPVLLRAQDHDLVGVAAESRRLVDSAHEGKLLGTGQGTFTISNLGMFGVVDSFTAIINPPEGAILAVGGTRQELRMAGGGFFPRTEMRVTLSCDHRAIDGVVAARFLQRLRWYLETARL